MPQADLRALVEYLARGLVDDPETVSVKASERERIVYIEIRVPADQVGKVIGRKGRIIGAIRTVAKAAAVRTGRRVVVEIVH